MTDEERDAFEVQLIDDPEFVATVAVIEDQMLSGIDATEDTRSGSFSRYAFAFLLGVLVGGALLSIS